MSVFGSDGESNSRLTQRPGCLVTAATAVGTLALLAIVLGLFGLWSYFGPGPAARETDIVLRRASGVAGMAAELKRRRVIGSALLFRAAAEFTGADRKLKAGEYEFPRGISLHTVLQMIASGQVVRHFVTLPEGRTSAQAVAMLRADPILTGDVITPPEGALLPDTYEVTRGEPREMVVSQMRAARDAVLAQLWTHRASDLPFTRPQDAVTLASIVEKETALAAERPKVAAVYVNRLRKGMKLDADPTTLYGISHGEPLGRGLKQSELTAATPYNTYVVAGLPPTPIANPGRASLEAVFRPARTSDLYFVANGAGGSSFSATYEEHVKNVAHWRQMESAAANRKAGCAASPASSPHRGC